MTITENVTAKSKEPTTEESTLLIEVDGRKLNFRVEARNERELIGEGTHRRTIVPLGVVGAGPARKA